MTEYVQEDFLLVLCESREWRQVAPPIPVALPLGSMHELQGTHGIPLAKFH